jgi:hypothetical protein
MMLSRLCVSVFFRRPRQPDPRGRYAAVRASGDRRRQPFSGGRARAPFDLSVVAQACAAGLRRVGPGVIDSWGGDFLGPIPAHVVPHKRKAKASKIEGCFDWRGLLLLLLWLVFNFVSPFFVFGR